MMVMNGTRIFQYMATVLVLAIHLMPNRFSAVKMNIMAIATARPFPVSSRQAAGRCRAVGRRSSASRPIEGSEGTYVKDERLRFGVRSKVMKA
jgi:hypothetical protein